MTGGGIGFARSPSDQIRKARIGLAETDAEPQEKRRDRSANRAAREVKLAPSAKQAPAKAVDDSDQRVEGIEQPPLRRHDLRTEPDRRDIKPKLGMSANTLRWQEHPMTAISTLCHIPIDQQKNRPC
jgi:hypothetical protein